MFSYFVLTKGLINLAHQFDNIFYWQLFLFITNSYCASQVIYDTEEKSLFSSVIFQKGHSLHRLLRKKVPQFRSTIFFDGKLQTDPKLIKKTGKPFILISFELKCFLSMGNSSDCFLEQKSKKIKSSSLELKFALKFET